MTYVIIFLVGLLSGVAAMFFIGKNNAAKMEAAYAKAIAAEAAIKKELEALKSKLG